ncbi:hypothetical protein ACFIQG_02960 [Comamonas odontotermitis]|uniref:hypothetical protein n=1 Tax=Comamonas odontotermitis TaxID=379895 RepID=UPI0036706786
MILFSMKLRKRMMKCWSENIFLLFYMLTLLFAGVTIMAITPPWEGFDESAHYSSVRYVAELKQIPLYGSANMDAEVENYEGPKPYGTLNPPFDLGITYLKFFQSKNDQEKYVERYNNKNEMPRFREGVSLNWQTQHPPLYYVIISPVLKMVSHKPLVDQLFVLRFVSFLMALAGISFAYKAFRNKLLPLKKDPVVIGFLLYPLLLPMLFFEFARLGNDALCLFLAGGLAWGMEKVQRTGCKYYYVLACGVILGLGLLTKAFFIPIGMAVALWVFFDFFKNRRNGAAIERVHLFAKLSIFLLAFLVGGWWYFYKLISVGSLSGSFDGIVLDAQGGFWVNFFQNASLFGILRGMVATFVTYVWSGSWSLARLPNMVYLPQILLVLGVFGGYVWFLFEKRPKTFSQIWLPVWLSGMFGIGMLHHILISVAINGNGNTPGWYMHILLPWIASTIGAGTLVLFSHKLLRRIMVGLMGYAIFFVIAAMWSQFSMFMGCASKAPTKMYEFHGSYFCVADFLNMYSHLKVIGSPAMAGFGLAGFFCCMLLMCVAWRRAKE